MKKNVILAAMLLLTITTVTAQNFRIGVSSGIDAAKFAISGASGGPIVYKNDLAGGIHFEGVISPNFGVQVEANYAAQGAGIINADGTTAASYQLNYITIPVLAKLYANNRLSFFAGPQIGFLLNAKTKYSGQPDTDVKKQLKSNDFYAVFGAEYRFANGLFVSSRYNLGLQNIVKDQSSNTEIKSRYLSFRLGYSFSLGSNKKK